MDKENIFKLIGDTENPERVLFGFFDDGTLYIQSRENTNDTWGWFHINSERLEKGFIEMGLSWCYIFETAPRQKPFIYMFVGELVTKEYAIKESRVAIETLAKDRELYFENKFFSLIDKDKYDKSITELERMIRKASSDIIEIYEA